MTHVSRRPLPRKTLDKILNSLVLVLTRIRKREKMGEFLGALLSETERTMLAKRLMSTYLLSEESEESIIAAALKVTPATVSRLKMWYELKGAGYQSALKELRQQREIEELKNLLLKVAGELIKNARYI